MQMINISLDSKLRSLRLPDSAAAFAMLIDEDRGSAFLVIRQKLAGERSKWTSLLKVREELPELRWQETCSEPWNDTSEGLPPTEPHFAKLTFMKKKGQWTMVLTANGQLFAAIQNDLSQKDIMMPPEAKMSKSSLELLVSEMNDPSPETMMELVRQVAKKEVNAPADLLALELYPAVEAMEAEDEQAALELIEAAEPSTKLEFVRAVGAAN